MSNQDDRVNFRKGRFIPRKAVPAVRIVLVVMSIGVVGACGYILYLQMDQQRNEGLQELPLFGDMLAVPVEESTLKLPPDTVDTLPKPRKVTPNELSRRALLEHLNAVLPVARADVEREASRAAYEALHEALDPFEAGFRPQPVLEARFWLGIAARDSGRAEEGEKILEDLVLNHGDQRAAWNLARHYFGVERYGRSRYFLDRSPEHDNVVKLRKRIAVEEPIVSKLRLLETDLCRVRYARFVHFQAARKASEQCEIAFRLMRDQFDIPLPQTKVTVVLVEDEHIDSLMKGPKWVAGRYSYKVYIREESLSPVANLEKITRHEVTHAIFGLAQIRCPSWLNEGLAEFIEHETLKPGDVKRFEVLVGNGRKRPRRLSRFPSEFGHIKDGAQAVNDTCLQAHSMVLHLLKRYGARKVREALLALKKSQDPERDLWAALGTGGKAFYRGWLRNLTQRWRVRKKPVETPEEYPGLYL